MNYYGSYRKLLGNATSAMVGAVEIYNKPRFAYRDECVAVLLVNAWELALKALLSKNRVSIYYKKKPGQPYRTLALSDALNKATPLFPKGLPAGAVHANLDLITTYRDNVVHFYNAKGFALLMYSIAQTCVVNFRDLLRDAFSVDLGSEITWRLLPLGLEPPIDPVTYLRDLANAGTASPAEKQFVGEVLRLAKEASSSGFDTGRVVTLFTIKLESTKKLHGADAVVGVVGGEAGGTNPLAMERRVDPNVSHPLRTTDVIDEVGTLHGTRFTSHTFQAVVWKHGLKDKSRYCWRADQGILVKYSRDVVAFIRRLTKADLEACITDYRAHLHQRRRASSRGRRRS